MSAEQITWLNILHWVGSTALLFRALIGAEGWFSTLAAFCGYLTVILTASILRTALRRKVVEP